MAIDPRQRAAPPRESTLKRGRRGVPITREGSNANANAMSEERWRGARGECKERAATARNRERERAANPLRESTLKRCPKSPRRERSERMHAGRASHAGRRKPEA